MRMVLRFLVVALVVAGAVYLAEQPGSVTIVWRGWQVRMSLAALCLTLVVAVFLSWFLLDTLRRVAAAPSRLARQRREARRLVGYRALTDGLVAVASGNLLAAEAHARRAEKAFRAGRHEPPPLTGLLTAQTAWLRGAHDTAKSGFAALLDHGDTRFLGLRGLIVHALRENDISGALHLAERAEGENPQAPWAVQIRLELEARSRHWRQAGETLDRAQRRRLMAPDDIRRHRVAALLARSAEAVADARDRDALTHAAAACRLAPSFAPAAIAYADLLRVAGQTARARRVLESAWRRAAHPALAAAYERLIDQDEPNQRLTRFERFVALRPHDPESHLSAAAVALSAHLWGEAGRHLQLAGASGPGPWSARLCRLAAELALAQPAATQNGSAASSAAATARLWTDRIAVAPADPAWTCTACAAESAVWQPLCPACDAFDTLEWRTGGTLAPARPAAASALPLLDQPRV